MADMELSVAMDTETATAAIDRVTECAQRASGAMADLDRAIAAARDVQIGIRIVQLPPPDPVRRNRLARAWRAFCGKDVCDG